MEHPAGEADDSALRVDVGRCLTFELRGSGITSGDGLLACRAFDDALGLTDSAGDAPSACRRGRHTPHLLAGLLRQSLSGQEAFACQGLCHRDRPRRPEELPSVDRGAISIGQPCGMSGARMSGQALADGSAAARNSTS